MKNLIYKNETYYLCDEMSNLQGKTTCTSKQYVASKDNMPHTKFSKSHIVIYGRSTCPYCIKILNFLKTKDALYKKVIFVEIDSEPSELFAKKNLLSILQSDIGSHTTVPIVFYKGEFIGGSDKAKDFFTNF